MNPAVTRDPILVADDNDGYRETLVEYLQGRGFTTVAADNGRDGLKLARRHRLSLALLDIHMPGMDGLALFAALREMHRRLPVIFLTSEPTADVRRQAQALGAVSVLEKAVRIKRLMRLIDTITHGDWTQLLRIAEMAALLLDPSIVYRHVLALPVRPEPDNDIEKESPSE